MDDNPWAHLPNNLGLHIMDHRARVPGTFLPTPAPRGDYHPRSSTYHHRHQQNVYNEPPHFGRPHPGHLEETPRPSRVIMGVPKPSSTVTSAPASDSEDLEVITGVVTQFQGDCGMISKQIFFHRSCVQGQTPNVGDKVVVDAQRVTEMPFKFNAKKVLLISEDLSEESYLKELEPLPSSRDKSAEDSFFSRNLHPRERGDFETLRRDFLPPPLSHRIPFRIDEDPNLPSERRRRQLPVEFEIDSWMPSPPPQIPIQVRPPSPSFKKRPWPFPREEPNGKWPCREDFRPHSTGYSDRPLQGTHYGRDDLLVLPERISLPLQLPPMNERESAFYHRYGNQARRIPEASRRSLREPIREERPVIKRPSVMTNNVQVTVTPPQKDPEKAPVNSPLEKAPAQNAPEKPPPNAEEKAPPPGKEEAPRAPVIFKPKDPSEVPADFLCYRCGQQGHLAAICPNPRNKDALKNHMKLHPECKRAQNRRRYNKKIKALRKGHALGENPNHSVVSLRAPSNAPASSAGVKSDSAASAGSSTISTAPVGAANNPAVPSGAVNNGFEASGGAGNNSAASSGAANDSKASGDTGKNPTGSSVATNDYSEAPGDTVNTTAGSIVVTNDFSEAPGDTFKNAAGSSEAVNSSVASSEAANDFEPSIDKANNLAASSEANEFGASSDKVNDSKASSADVKSSESLMAAINNCEASVESATIPPSTEEASTTSAAEGEVSGISPASVGDSTASSLSGETHIVPPASAEGTPSDLRVTEDALNSQASAESLLDTPAPGDALIIPPESE